MMRKYSWPEIAKAVAAFLVSFGLLCGSLATNDAVKAVLPEQWLAYLVALGGAATVASVVFGIKNKLNEKQVIDGAKDLGIQLGAPVVVEAAVNSAAQAAKNSVEEIAKSLPKPARDAVQAGAEHTSAVVEQVLRDFKQQVTV